MTDVYVDELNKLLKESTPDSAERVIVAGLLTALRRIEDLEGGMLRIASERKKLRERIERLEAAGTFNSCSGKGDE